MRLFFYATLWDCTLLGSPLIIVSVLLLETETIASWIKWVLAGLFVLWVLGFGLPRLRR